MLDWGVAKLVAASFDEGLMVGVAEQPDLIGRGRDSDEIDRLGPTSFCTLFRTRSAVSAEK